MVTAVVVNNIMAASNLEDNNMVGINKVDIQANNKDTREAINRVIMIMRSWSDWR
jgi:hypothetical protein